MQNIKIVEGSSSAGISNKNLFNITNYTNLSLHTNGSPTNVTKNIDNFSFTSGVNNGGVYFTNAKVKQYIDDFNAEQNYIISIQVNSSNDTSFQIGAVTKQTFELSKGIQTISIQTKFQNSGFVFYNKDTTETTYTISKIQIEINNSITSFVPHKEQTYPITLPTGMFLGSIGTASNYIYGIKDN